MESIDRYLYVKLTDKEYVISIINDTRSHGEYKYHTGEIFPVELAVEGWAIRKSEWQNFHPKY